jgi:hypothetical protein
VSNCEQSFNSHQRQTIICSFCLPYSRMVYVQMESLSGLPAKEDWDFVFNGYSNAPFIKTNYPHQTGVWSWDTEADQVALVIQYIRRSMVEYSDVVWYMSHEVRKMCCSLCSCKV